MHVNNTGEIGMIKIVGIERIQDGVERLRFCAGEKAIEYIQKQESLLKEAANLLKTEPSRLKEAIERLLKENKRMQKEMERMQKSVAKYEEYYGIRIIMQDEMAAKTIKELTNEKSVVISASMKNDNAILTIACSPDLSLDCSEIAKNVASKFGSKGGGKRTIGMAGIKSNDMEKAKEEVLKMVKEAIKHNL